MPGDTFLSDIAAGSNHKIDDENARGAMVASTLLQTGDNLRDYDLEMRDGVHFSWSNDPGVDDYTIDENDNDDFMRQSFFVLNGTQDGSPSSIDQEDERRNLESNHSVLSIDGVVEENEADTAQAEVQVQEEGSCSVVNVDDEMGSDTIIDKCRGSRSARGAWRTSDTPDTILHKRPRSSSPPPSTVILSPNPAKRVKTSHSPNTKSPRTLTPKQQLQKKIRELSRKQRRAKKSDKSPISHSSSDIQLAATAPGSGSLERIPGAHMGSFTMQIPMKAQESPSALYPFPGFTSLPAPPQTQTPITTAEIIQDDIMEPQSIPTAISSFEIPDLPICSPLEHNLPPVPSLILPTNDLPLLSPPPLNQLGVSLPLNMLPLVNLPPLQTPITSSEIVQDDIMAGSEPIPTVISKVPDLLVHSPPENKSPPLPSFILPLDDLPLTSPSLNEPGVSLAVLPLKNSPPAPLPSMASPDNSPSPPIVLTLTVPSTWAVTPDPLPHGPSLVGTPFTSTPPTVIPPPSHVTSPVVSSSPVEGPPTITLTPPSTWITSTPTLAKTRPSNDLRPVNLPLVPSLPVKPPPTNVLNPWTDIPSPNGLAPTATSIPFNIRPVSSPPKYPSLVPSTVTSPPVALTAKAPHAVSFTPPSTWPVAQPPNSTSPSILPSATLPKVPLAVSPTRPSSSPVSSPPIAALTNPPPMNQAAASIPSRTSPSVTSHAKPHTSPVTPRALSAMFQAPPAPSDGGIGDKGKKKEDSSALYPNPPTVVLSNDRDGDINMEVQNGENSVQATTCQDLTMEPCEQGVHVDGGDADNESDESVPIPFRKSRSYKYLTQNANKPCTKGDLAQALLSFSIEPRRARRRSKSDSSSRSSSRSRSPPPSRRPRLRDRKHKARYYDVPRNDNELKRQVREYAAFILGEKPWTVPTTQQLSNFKKHKDVAPGPSLENFSLDLESKGLSSAWNKRAIEVFAVAFMACPEHDPATKSSVTHAFGSHLQTLRRHHTRFLSEANLDPDIVDLESLNQKILKKRDMRRRGLHRRRNISVLYYSAGDEGDAYLKNTVNTFWKYVTPDVMSGDETDPNWQGPENQKPYYIHILDWRNPEVLVFFRILDALHFSEKFENDSRIEPGRFCNTRVRCNVVVREKVVRGLPENFYNPEWLKSLTPVERANLRMRPSVELNFEPKTLKIAARFMNIKHRQSKPLAEDHPAVLEAFEKGISAPIFSLAKRSAMPISRSGNPTQQSPILTTTTQSHSSTPTPEQQPGPKTTQFVDAEAGPSKPKA